jgi:hypothetical protein
LRFKTMLYAQPYGLVIFKSNNDDSIFCKRYKSDRKVINERNRPLTDGGVFDSYKVMEMLKDKKNRCIYF